MHRVVIKTHDKIMNDVFYHELSGVLFWVAGYCGNSINVTEIVKEYQKDAAKLAKLAGVSIDVIKTHEITKSSRYKYMRVYFIENFDSSKLEQKDEFYKKIGSQSVLPLGENWENMGQWLEN